jgi:hypothetical protein
VEERGDGEAATLIDTSTVDCGGGAQDGRQKLGWSLLQRERQGKVRRGSIQSSRGGRHALAVLTEEGHGGHVAAKFR